MIRKFPNVHARYEQAPSTRSPPRSPGRAAPPGSRSGHLNAEQRYAFQRNEEKQFAVEKAAADIVAAAKELKVERILLIVPFGFPPPRGPFLNHVPGHDGVDVGVIFTVHFLQRRARMQDMCSVDEKNATGPEKTPPTSGSAVAEIGCEEDWCEEDEEVSLDF